METKEKRELKEISNAEQISPQNPQDEKEGMKMERDKPD